MAGRLFPILLFLAAMACGLAAGGESHAAGPADPAGAVWRTLFEYGALGTFLVYMMFRETKRDRRDQEQREREEKSRSARLKREEERQQAAEERFIALDAKLVNLIERSCTSIAEMNGILSETRNILKEHNAELYRLNSLLAYDKAGHWDKTRRDARMEGETKYMRRV